MIESILIADQHELFRESLIISLKTCFPKCKFLEAANGNDLIYKIKNNCPQIIIMDIILPEKHGFEVLEELRYTALPSKFIILTELSSKEFLYTSKEFNVNAYLTKNTSVEMLSETITRISMTNSFICTNWFALQFDLEKEFNLNILDNIKRLTPREKKVLRFLLENPNMTKTSEKLMITEKSLNNYKYRITKKLDINGDTKFNEWVLKYAQIVRYLV